MGLQLQRLMGWPFPPFSHNFCCFPTLFAPFTPFCSINRFIYFQACICAVAHKSNAHKRGDACTFFILYSNFSYCLIIQFSLQFPLSLLYSNICLHFPHPLPLHANPGLQGGTANPPIKVAQRHHYIFIIYRGKWKSVKTLIHVTTWFGCRWHGGS